MTDLVKRHCEPCEGKTSPLGRDEAQGYMSQVKEWQLSGDAKSISRDLLCGNFVAAVEFINRVKDIAEAEDHHPDLHLTGYKKLRIELSTHAIGGLSENDFIVAAKINELKA